MFVDPIKNYLSVAVIASVLGFLGGYHFSSAKAEVDRLKVQQVALQEENKNLIKKLEVEHEQQKQSQITFNETQEDLADLEKRYSDVVNELNLLQLQSDLTDSSTSTLPSDASASGSVQKDKCKCIRPDSKEFQNFTANQLMISKDCDITTTYYNHLIDWYNKISQETIHGN